MMKDNKYVVDTLEDLIEVSRDGQHGYRDAAEHVKDSQLKKFLNEVSLERAKFAGDLENETVRYGKSDVDRTGSALGAIHRGWADLKANVGAGDDAVLSSIETGDKGACDRYDKAIREGKLPDEILGIVRNQAQALVGTLDRVRSLRQHRKAA